MQMGMPIVAQHGGMATLLASPFLAELGPTAPQSIHGQVWRQNLGFRPVIVLKSAIAGRQNRMAIRLNYQ